MHGVFPSPCEAASVRARLSNEASREPEAPLSVAAGLALLHSKCSVFTMPIVAEALLDAIGWLEQRDLTTFKLLEPACGDGALVVPAAVRLFRSAKERGLHLDERLLSGCLAAYEIDSPTIGAARAGVVTALVKEGARPRFAGKLARQWIREADFLVQPHHAEFTHVATNPPYLRWSRIPTRLRRLYETGLPRHAARGDLSLAFLQKSLDALADGGHCAFLFPDRWLRSKYGEEFRSGLSGKASLVAHIEAHELPVFAGARKVETYPAVSLFQAGADRMVETAFHRPKDLEELAHLCRSVGAIRLRIGEPPPAITASASLGRSGGAMLWDRDAQMLVSDISDRFPTLAEAGVAVRCGTALGVLKAFVLDDPTAIEADRVVPFVRSSDVGSDGAVRPSAWVANPWDNEGNLVDLDHFPLLAVRLEAYKAALEARACVRNDREWYRTIDKIRPEAVAADKIVVAGLADRARIGMSTIPCQPGNGLYTMRSEIWPLPALAKLLRTGVMDLFAQVLAPRMRNGSKRFDGYFLSQVRVPRWNEVSPSGRRMIEGDEWDGADIVAETYGLERANVARILGEAAGSRAVRICGSSV